MVAILESFDILCLLLVAGAGCQTFHFLRFGVFFMQLSIDYLEETSQDQAQRRDLRVLCALVFNSVRVCSHVTDWKRRIFIVGRP